MRRSWIAALALIAVTAPIVPAQAQGARASSATEFARMAERLKPGEWVWAPGVAPNGQIVVYVDLSRQLATVYRNGVRIGVSSVSSGKPGHETPTGVFTILQKDAKHRSSKYNDAPMPFQQRLTWDGVALHAGGLPGYPESHGCVHLPYGFSRELFGITSLGATVVIDGDAARHVRTSDTSLLAPFDAKGRPIEPTLLDREEFSWRPERAPSGPMTVIVSKSDRQVVVMRSGVEIGRSVATVNDDDPGSHVITLTRGADGAPRWVYIGLPGHEEEAGRSLDEAVINRLRLPRGFYEQVRVALRPGTTILITQSRVGSSGGEPLTVMDAVVPQP
ncbi:L,D-transpeptidase family protein [Sphingomonas sp. RRHST34]|uniref:L,D-transpeptidase family protein n=1 Tax=Sphingomonas citri TaxID=2862499 RepID=A0ABS7BTB8_9SPHN|nr:L,D-transpeptidase family protein [Sphingomonas citri]MBW6532639.1 L,D-transpeptidase family protein [Sphingomonas citri]